MTSKPKSRTYIVLHRGRTKRLGCTILGRYRVGARNKKEAEQLLRNTIGKHAKVQVYYEDTEKLVPHGTVIDNLKG